ncbi:MAG: ABC transporter ATP-binding protein [Bacteroidetes bacterium]|nr:MAG: ABC transporter ATP-binding protein [Bacteroidota bacterium]
MTNILKIDNLTKLYGTRTVLNQLNLEVKKGSVFGLLGPNGSGKTTTLSILLDIIPANGGHFDWFEGTSSNPRKRIGSLLESPNFYGHLSAERNLKIAADIKEVSYSDISRVLSFVNLEERKNDKFSTFSLGMKQRLALASSLLGSPEVLILDEPTNGLDPQGIYDIRELIHTISSQGITIIIASHMLDEIEKVCSDVAIIKDGTLITSGKVSEILGDDHIIIVQASDMKKLERDLKEIESVTKIDKNLEQFTVSFSKDISTAELNKLMFDKGTTLTHLEKKQKNLEMQFLELTK